MKFREGDARRCAVGESAYDCVVMMGNSFGYFEREEDDLAVLTAIKRALKSNGRVAIDLTDGDWLRKNYEPRSWEWIDQDHFVCRERTLSSDGDRLVSREVVVHAEQGVIADQFYAERLYSRGRMEDLLRRAGFGDVQVLDELEAYSTRGTDVGMMMRRNLVSARAPAKQPARKKTRPHFPDVTVLLGDPRLPDMVKKTGHFAAETWRPWRNSRRRSDRCPVTTSAIWTIIPTCSSGSAKRRPTSCSTCATRGSATTP